MILGPESLFLLAFVGRPMACIVRLQFYILIFLNCKAIYYNFWFETSLWYKETKCKLRDFTIPGLIGWAIYIKRHALLGVHEPFTSIEKFMAPGSGVQALYQGNMNIY